jgi:integrase
MGSINTRKGKLVFDFRYQGVRCREQSKLSDSSSNRKRAKAIIERIEAEIMLGTFLYENYFPNSNKAALFSRREKTRSEALSNVPKLEEFADIWFGECEVEWKTSHILNVRGSLDRYIIPEFGNQYLDQITKASILSFRSKLSKLPGRGENTTWSAEHINHTLTPLRQILNEAAERYSFVSPYRGIKTLKVPRTEVEPFSISEVTKIINNVRNDFKDYYTVRFYTGMRSAEIDGLQWKYVDFERRQILIRKTWVNGEITSVKNDGSQREISMSQPVYDALKRHHKHTSNGTFVFSNTNGNPLNANNITKRVWYPLLRYLDLKKRRPYQTRHTTATLWLGAGENPEWIARQMGHTTTEMLFRVYSRYVPNLTRNDGSAFERLLTEKTK